MTVIRLRLLTRRRPPSTAEYTFLCSSHRTTPGPYGPSRRAVRRVMQVPAAPDSAHPRRTSIVAGAVVRLGGPSRRTA
ncbi:hypothetical protein ACRAWF_04070 [Streptomyces sp. L7]